MIEVLLSQLDECFRDWSCLLHFCGNKQSLTQGVVSWVVIRSRVLVVFGLPPPMAISRRDRLRGTKRIRSSSELGRRR